MDFYLSINNRERVILLPVNPTEFTVGNPWENEVFSTLKGPLKLIGERGLKTLSFSSFFPMADADYNKNKDFLGMEYIDFIEELRVRKLPLRLIITETPINMPVTIEEFEWTRGRGNKLNYNISFEEYVFTQGWL